LASRAMLITALAVTLLGANAGVAAAQPSSAGPMAASTSEEPPGPSEAVDGAPLAAAAAPPALTAANFRLKATAYSSIIAGLDAALPKATVPAVVGDGNRAAAACTASASNRLASFCWKDTDNTTDLWVPQGITSTADADVSGSYQGATALVASWHDSGAYEGTHGVRLSFVDYSKPATPTYRHILLVTPKTASNGKASFGQVDLHAGGLFWYGNYIYLAATDGGLRVFDLNHMYEVNNTDDAAIGLQSNGTYGAFNYKYVLPQAFQYDRSSTGGYTNLTYSFVSLDRTSTPPSIVVGEYAYPGTGTRLVRFPTTESSHMLTASSDGYVHGTQAYNVSVTSMQGGASINGKYYLSTSDGASNKGDLATFAPGGSVVMHTDTLPIGNEDLSYWKGKDQLWSVTEFAGSRSIFAVRASAY
jgi:hypothetical protein